MEDFMKKKQSELSIPIVTLDEFRSTVSSILRHNHDEDAVCGLLDIADELINQSDLETIVRKFGAFVTLPTLAVDTGDSRYVFLVGQQSHMRIERS